jgi:hypothetical protein
VISQVVPERGCVVLDQPQQVGRRRSMEDFPHAPLVDKLLRLVSDTTALRQKTKTGVE